MSDWRHDNARWLATALRALREDLERHALAAPALPDGRRALSWLVAGDLAVPSRSEPAELSALEAQMDRPPALLALARSLEFGDFESYLLLLAAAPALDPAFAQAFAELHDDSRRDHVTLGLALALFASGAGEQRLLAADVLLPDGPLRALQLVDVADDETTPLVSRRISVDERMTGFVRGANRIDARLRPLMHELPPGRTAPETSAAIDALAERFEESPAANILTADEGAGTEFAQQLAAVLDVRLCALDAHRMAELPPQARLKIVRLLAREALLGRLALVVNAADPAAAAVAAEIADGFGGVLLVVGPEPLSTYPQLQVVRVPATSRGDQAAAWHATLARYGQSLNGEVDAIVQQFELTGAEIDETVARALELGDGAITGETLRWACRERPTPALDSIARRIEPAFDWDDMVVSSDVREQLRELADQVEQRSLVYETWGFGAQLVRGRGITALFSGPSGVGKTMAAEVLARHLDLELRRIDLAGITSKWVGETSKNVRRIFDVAERSGAILFFDEADALFGQRTEVRDSHDRYANVEVDYLLQRMEEYTGLAILATNRRDALDAAFLRRLRFAIDFPFPTVEDRRRIWEHVFPTQAALDEVDYGCLARLELSGGNIRSIAVNAAFLAARYRAAIGMPHLARAASREYAKLGKPMTAADLGPYYEAVRG